MNQAARDNYLATEVATAPPQKLQLMLIEGAIRFALQGQDHWRAGDEGAAAEAISRSQQIVSEIIAGLNPEHDAELVRQVASVYLFVFRALLAAQLEQSEERLQEALRVLEIERQTWRELCLRTESAPPTAPPVDDDTTWSGGFSLTV